MAAWSARGDRGRRGACGRRLGVAAQSDGCRRRSKFAAPAGRRLQSIPLPAVDDLEPAVAAQIREEGQRVGAAGRRRARVGARDLADAYGALGQVLHVYEFFEPAELSYANAIRLAPGDARWPHLLGYLYQQTGRLNDAVEQFTAARRIQPPDQAATVRLGDVYLRPEPASRRPPGVRARAGGLPGPGTEGARGGGDSRAAVRRRGAALRRSPPRVPTATSLHYSLAMAHRGLGRSADAQSHLATRGPGAIRVGDPIVDGLQAAGAWRARAAWCSAGGPTTRASLQEAAEAFARAVEAAPASAPARVNLGLARLQLGNTVEAVQEFRAALASIPPTPWRTPAGAGCCAGSARTSKPFAHLQAAIDQSPDDAAVARQLVGALVRLGRADEAIAALNRMRAADATTRTRCSGLVILLSDQQRYREAVAAARRRPSSQPRSADDGHHAGAPAGVCPRTIAA